MAVATDREYEEQLTDIAARVERLRVHYQSYFLGMEKRPPLQKRDQLERLFRESPLQDARRTVSKFRFQSLQQRYRIMAVYWDRIMRDLEEGRTTREALRREAGYRDAPKPALTIDDRPPQPPEREQPDPMKMLYIDYIRARNQVGLDNKGITETAFKNSLEKQRVLQKQRLGAKDVDFSVTVRDGKVVLLARPVTDESA